MGLRHSILPSMVLSFVLIFGCATTLFPYKRYNLNVENVEVEKGILMGPNEGLDKPLSLCRVSAQEKFPCVVYLRPEHEKLQRDYTYYKNKAESCR